MAAEKQDCVTEPLQVRGDSFLAQSFPWLDLRESVEPVADRWAEGTQLALSPGSSLGD